jgi:hypothetical protein
MATYSISQNSIVEMQMLGTLHGQRTRNIFHYRYTGSTQLDGPTTLDALMDEFEAEIQTPLRLLLSNEWMNDGVMAQLISPTRYRARFKAVATAGGVVSSSLPSTSCVVLRRKAIASGRQYQGRVFIPGIPTQYEDNSRLGAGVIAGWTAAADLLKEPLEGGTAVEAFVPTITKIGPATALYDVDIVELDTILRSQRRREVGVGE